MLFRSSGVGNGVGVGVSGGVVGGAIGGVPAVTVNAVVRRAGSEPPPAPQSQFQTAQAVFNSQDPLTIKNITIVGLPDQARTELLSRLPAREGDTFSNDVIQKITQAARDFDEHVAIRFQNDNTGGVSIVISVPAVDQSAPQRIKVGGNVQAVMVLSKVQPLYPQLAKSARVEGVVHLAVIKIGRASCRERV